jgi:hypothetical protein
LRPSLATGTIVLTAAIVVVSYAVGGGSMFNPGSLNEQTHRSAPIGGVSTHAALANNCSACHPAPWSSQTMADRCMDCHTGVRDQLNSGGSMHGKIPAGSDCRACHTEHRGATAALTNLAKFDHDWTSFKLTGKHVQIQCQECHKNQTYQGVAQTCVSCHAEPKVHKGLFSTSCSDCHSTSSWATSKSTVSIAFNHDSTRFKLTGKHRVIDCKACHRQDTYHGLAKSTSCFSCHAEPTSHKGQFGTACAKCHSTETWSGAVLEHNVFNLFHRGSNAVCSKCHNDAKLGNYHSYTCYNCHEHRPERLKLRRGHQNVANLDHCMACHGPNRKRRAATSDGMEGAMVCMREDDLLSIRGELGLPFSVRREQSSDSLANDGLFSANAKRQAGLTPAAAYFVNLIRFSPEAPSWPARPWTR